MILIKKEERFGFLTGCNKYEILENKCDGCYRRFKQIKHALSEKYMSYSVGFDDKKAYKIC
ncbi:hypothetical protein D1094_17750 [Colwellia sp. RSH04]|nr:hypothetical protein D1094_17750 [Colwellia sp. RSH04]